MIDKWRLDRYLSSRCFINNTCIDTCLVCVYKCRWNPRRHLCWSDCFTTVKQLVCSHPVSTAVKQVIWLVFARHTVSSLRSLAFNQSSIRHQSHHLLWRPSNHFPFSNIRRLCCTLRSPTLHSAKTSSSAFFAVFLIWKVCIAGTVILFYYFTWSKMLFSLDQLFCI